jgi:hypothetical protein
MVESPIPIGLGLAAGSSKEGGLTEFASYWVNKAGKDTVSLTSVRGRDEAQAVRF